VQVNVVLHSWRQQQHNSTNQTRCMHCSRRPHPTQFTPVFAIPVTGCRTQLTQLSHQGHRQASQSEGSVLQILPSLHTFSGPTPRPSLISIVMARDTTSRDARSLAVGAYLQTTGRCSRPQSCNMIQTAWRQLRKHTCRHRTDAQA
jgi:hypothetical protein